MSSLSPKLITILIKPAPKNGSTVQKDFPSKNTKILLRNISMRISQISKSYSISVCKKYIWKH